MPDDEMAALVESIRSFGLVDPILVRRDDLLVIGGHQRLEAARRLGIREVPIVELDLTEERVELPLTADMLDEAIGSAVERIDATVTRTLAEAGLGAEDIDTLFLTGGSTEIPAVRQGIVNRLPQARLVKGDVFGSVGLGLALDAQRKFG